MPLSLSSLSLSPPPVTLIPTDTGLNTWRAPWGFTAFPGAQARSESRSVQPWAAACRSALQNAPGPPGRAAKQAARLEGGHA